VIWDRLQLDVTFTNLPEAKRINPLDSISKAQAGQAWAARRKAAAANRAAPNKIQFNGVGGGLRTYIRCMRIGDQPSR
jgi:hypothetical protein